MTIPMKFIQLYMRKYKKENRELIEEELEKNLNARKIITGYFNARIGTEQGAEIIEEEICRNSEDNEEKIEGKILLKWVKENGLIILNGNKSGDEKSEYTYIGNGATAIDYGMLIGEFID